jgi:beta-lactamase class A
MKLKLAKAIAATLIGAAPLPAIAQAPQAPAANVPAPSLTTRLDQLVKLLNDSGNYAEMFSIAFREQVPEAQFQAIAAQLRAQGGAATGVGSITPAGSSQATAAIDYEKLIVTVSIALDPAGTHQIAGLRITGTEPRDDSMAKLEADFRKLHGEAGFGIYRLSENGVTPFAEVNGDVPAPLGSAFKLWILAEASREVAALERHWSDVVRVRQHSLPSGILQTWPDDAPVTLQTLATLMISISDNTATDTLLTTLGQRKVGAMVRQIGVSDPDRTLPVMTTREAFELKTPEHQSLADEWATGTPEARQKLLAANAAAMRAPVDPKLFDGKPVRIDSIEWFASPADMARTLNWLRVHGGPTTQAILAVNPGTDATTARRFAYLGYKGGSEPGVITLNFLVRTPAGQWLAVTGNWHDPEATVDDREFLSLMNRALVLASR